MDADVRIFIRDPIDFSILDEVTQAVEFEATVRLDDISAWKLTMQGTYADSLNLSPLNCIEVWRGEDRIIEGPIMDIHKQVQKGARITEVSGGDNRYYLNTRVCYPSSSGLIWDATKGHYYFSGDAANEGYDIIQGNAETVMKTLVMDNCADRALTARRIPNLTVADSMGRGNAVTSSARFDNLLTQVQNIGLASAGLHFDITRQADQLVFDTFYGRDYTSGKPEQIVFSEDNQTLREYDLRIDVSTGNYIIVGGPGSGWDQAFGFQEDLESEGDFGRVEMFMDASGLSTTATDAEIESALAQAGQMQLTSSAYLTQISLVLEENNMLQYIRNFKLGDMVTVDIEGIPYDDTITEIYYIYSSSSQTSASNLQTAMKARKSLRMIMKKLKQHDAMLNTLFTQVAES